MQEERAREREQLEATISDLRAERERLLKVIEEQAGTVKQLTYQPKPEPAAPEAPPPPVSQPPAAMRPWVVALAAAVAAIAGLVAAALYTGAIRLP